jgi:glycosyltransferase involved in cell wall biosynthesis
MSLHAGLGGTLRNSRSAIPPLVRNPGATPTICQWRGGNSLVTLGFMGELTYAAITPARDEAENLPRLADSLACQTVKPIAWVVVDDGSRDRTREIVESFSAGHPWAAVIPGPADRDGPLQAGRREGRDVLAFNAGVAALPHQVDIVLKLDADVSLESDFFERLLEEFDSDPLLGIAGGTCLELEGGEWRERFVTGAHVRGATRAYRWACLEDVRPLVERLGWDGIDEAKAALRGWQTRTVAGLPFYHHRPVGRRDGARSSWESQGATARFMGYRFWYLALRSLFWARRDPRALAMMIGWLRDAIARAPVYDDPAVVAEIRKQRSFRELSLRSREALGRR